MIRPSLPFCCLALSLALGPADAQQATQPREESLRLEHEVGARSLFTLHATYTTKFVLPGIAPVTNVRVLTFELSQVVKSKDEDGVATSEATVIAVKARNEQASPAGASTWSYDSEADADGGSPLLRILRHALGRSFTIRVGPTGEVHEIKGATLIREFVKEAARGEEAAIAASLPRIPAGPQGARIDYDELARNGVDQTTMVLHDSVLRVHLNELLDVFPSSGKADPKGWTRDRSVRTQAGDLTYRVRYVAKPAEDGKTPIECSLAGEISGKPLPDADALGPLGPMLGGLLTSMRFQRGATSGKATFARGRVRTSESHLESQSVAPLPKNLGLGPNAELTFFVAHTLRYESRPASLSSKAPGD